METIQQSVTCHVNCYRRRNSIQTLLYKSKSKLPTHTSTLHTHHSLLIPSPSHSHLNGVEILRRRQLDFPESVGNGNDDHFFVFTSIRNDARAAGVLRSIYFLLQLHLYIILYRYVRVQREMLDIMYIQAHTYGSRVNINAAAELFLSDLAIMHLGRWAGCRFDLRHNSLQHVTYQILSLTSFLFHIIKRSVFNSGIRSTSVRLAMFLFLYYIYAHELKERWRRYYYIKYGRRRI